MDAEENERCGAPLAQTPGTEEETCEEALLWIDEMMAGMEFPIARTTASVREPANWGDQELEAVLVTGLSDVAEDGRESWVGKPTDKLLLVERDGRGITKENKNSPAEDEPRRELRGTTVTKTTSNGKTFAHNQEKTLRYSNRKPSQTKFGKTKRNATLLERHANKALSTTQTQRRHMACACAEAAYR